MQCKECEIDNSYLHFTQFNKCTHKVHNSTIPKIGLTHKNSPQWSRQLSQRALLRASEARLMGALSKGGKMRVVATNVYLWKTTGKPKETGQNENSKFGSCIYA